MSDPLATLSTVTQAHRQAEARSLLDYARTGLGPSARFAGVGYGDPIPGGVLVHQASGDLFLQQGQPWPGEGGKPRVRYAVFRGAGGGK